MRILKAILGLLLLILVAGVVGLLFHRGMTQDNIREAAVITAENGIESLEPIVVNDDEQWIYIRGQDKRNPLLLYLHGGPGTPELPLARHFGGELEKHFTVVHWDQRASGKSRRDWDEGQELTLEIYLQDAIELIEALTGRFEKDQVVLVGHSWGSYLGVLVARDRPDLVSSYFGVGQVVNMRENERISLEYVVEQARADGNETALADLEPLRPPYDDDVDGLFRQRQWLYQYGGGFRNVSLKSLGLALFYCPEYSLGDVWRYYKGTTDVARRMWPKMVDIDLLNQAPALEVPVFFLTGRHDYNTPFELVESYVEALDAPQKEIVWFEDSAHFPNVSAPREFQSAIISRTVMAPKVDITP